MTISRGGEDFSKGFWSRCLGTNESGTRGTLILLSRTTGEGSKAALFVPDSPLLLLTMVLSNGTLFI
ncbi:MAG: hypothetical protein V7709_12095 [Halioglobus sp.]